MMSLSLKIVSRVKCYFLMMLVVLEVVSLKVCVSRFV